MCHFWPVSQVGWHKPPGTWQNTNRSRYQIHNQTVLSFFFLRSAKKTMTDESTPIVADSSGPADASYYNKKVKTTAGPQGQGQVQGSRQLPAQEQDQQKQRRNSEQANHNSNNNSRQSYQKNYNNNYNNYNEQNGYSNTSNRYNNNNGNSYISRSAGNNYNNNLSKQQYYNSRGNSNGNNGNTNRYNNANHNGQYYNQAYRNNNPAQLNSTPQTNMAWPGYYGPQIVYVPREVAAAAAAGIPIDMSNLSPSMSPPVMNVPLHQPPQQIPNKLLQKTTTPPAPKKKIEITTKTGEKLDLTKLHNNASHSNSVSPNLQRATLNDSGTSSNSTPATTQNNSIDENLNNIKKSKINNDNDNDNDNINDNDKTNNNNADDKASATTGESLAEINRKKFLEQVRLRKEAMDKKKQLDKQSAINANDTKNSELKDETGKDEVSKEETESTPDENGTKQTVGNVLETVTEADTEAEKETETEIETEAETETNNNKYSNNNTREQNIEINDSSEHKTEQEEIKTDTIENEEQIDQRDHDDIKTENPESKAKTEVGETLATDYEVSKPTEEENKNNAVSLLPISDFLSTLSNVKPIDDIYAFNYPQDFESPDPKYKKTHIKYTYGPTFLLQFKDKIKIKPDEEWINSTQSKIVILPSMSRPRGANRVSFGGQLNRSGGADNMRAGSFRNNDRSNSRASSRRQHSRRYEDRKSNRTTTSYTSRKDRMENYSRRGSFHDDKPHSKHEAVPKQEDVAPFVPSANRWVPKSRVKKTEKKFAPDGVTEIFDNEDVQRKMKSLLNKLTLEKFDPISHDIIQLANQSQWESNGETLKTVIEQIFLKACDESYWSSMYAQLCGKIVKDLIPEIKDENNVGKTGPKLVLHYLVVRCHTEFEKGWSDKLPTNEDGTPLEPEMMSDEYYVAAAAKRRGLGLVRFIGFLYRLNLLTGKMMFESFRRLMKDLTDNPSEETLESVIELLNTVGEQFEGDSFSTGKGTLTGTLLLDKLFQLLQNVIDTGTVSNRIKFKLLDVKELRDDKKWNSEKKNQGPKTIQQIHDEEEKARQAKMANSRSSSRRGPYSNASHNDRSGRNGYSARDNYNSRGSYNSRENHNSRDSFNTRDNTSHSAYTRGSQNRYSTRGPGKEDKTASRPSVAANRFDALMHTGEDD